MAERKGVRLNRFLARCGVASRRACDELIEGGHVQVDDRVVTKMGVVVDPAAQQVRVDGMVVELAPSAVYVLHKPKGVVCTSARAKGRICAVDMLPESLGRLFTIGRLDKDSEGLLLLTNDGDLAQHLAHPRHGVTKTYRLRCRGHLKQDSTQKLARGVHLSDGKTGPIRPGVLKRTKSWTDVQIVIREGRNRELRRAFARVGHPVIDLRRVRVGGLGLGRLKRGEWRRLKRAEVEELLEPGGEQPRGRPRRGRPPKGRHPKGKRR